MIVGLVLMIVGRLFSVPLLWPLGLVILVGGLGMFILGRSGRQVGGRRHYY